MKHTVTKMLLATLFISFGMIGELWAQEEEPITVTFVVNTSTVADTLFPGDVVQMRGVINGDDTGQLNWGSTSAQATNIGGDYWEVDLELEPGDEVEYKFWVGSTDEDGLGFDGGWETGDNNVYTVPGDATEDIRTDVIYYARPDIGRVAPFSHGASVENEVAVHFRVNVGAQVELNQFDPENENQVVGVRGQIDQATGQVAYKFVIDDGSSVQWEDGDDKTFSIPAADTTLHWGFFNNQRPPEGDIVTADVEFQVNVSLLEELGYFNRALGDEVAVPGSFNGWDSATPMNYDEAEDLWKANHEITAEAGQNIAYKYFIIWDETRFDSEHANYIENLDPDNGWEEPGSFGGADRIYSFGSSTEQIATGDFGTDTGFFNSLPQQALITSDGTGTQTYPVTFQLDMSDALDHTEQPFNPAEDEVFLVVETPIFGLTQGIAVGDGQPALEIPAQRERLKFEATGSNNMYELELELNLPTENHFGFTIVYENPTGERVHTGGGFDAGRRYYRYIEPEEVLDELTIWPSGGYTLDPIQWKLEDLDFPVPPDYGLGDENEAAKFAMDEHGDKVTSIDWGETMLVLSAEPRLSEDNRNFFYSGTLYIQEDATSVDGTDGLVNEFSLKQNFPNPFNPSTTISFTLPTASDVKLEVYNMLGQRVATLINNQAYNSGLHIVNFDASNLASGVYFYRLQAGSFTQQRSMTLIK